MENTKTTWTIHELVDELNVSGETISSWLKQMGIAPTYTVNDFAVHIMVYPVSPEQLLRFNYQQHLLQQRGVVLDKK